MSALRHYRVIAFCDWLDTIPPSPPFHTNPAFRFYRDLTDAEFEAARLEMIRRADAANAEADALEAEVQTRNNPLLGTVRTYRGQSYTVTGSFQRQRKDGTLATILEWTSPCAQCGAPFTITTPAASRKFQPNRRCQKHKRPGHRVKGGGDA